MFVGLGVDDVFVIVQAWESLADDLQGAPIHIKMAHAMKHAGVSVTVTSFTDIVAFGIGATTVCSFLISWHDTQQSSFIIYLSP